MNHITINKKLYKSVYRSQPGIDRPEAHSSILFVFNVSADIFP